MFKKQALVILVSALAFTNVAQALGLGDIELNSNLNDPLDAQIELRQLRDLTSGEIIPTLASNDAFQRAGVERSFFLSNIQFEVEENEAGDLVIALSTRQPVREPFLNFLVEVNWPGGRLLKEYTVLLDPPVFDSGGSGDSLVIDPAAGSESSGSEASGSELTTTTTVSESDTTTESVPAEVEPRDEDLPPGQYRVQRNDTLWEIANDVAAGEGYRTQQVMLAIQDLNPEAFLNNNINRLKAGSLLNLPDEAQIATRSVQEAINEVQMQNEGRPAQPRSVAGEQQTEVQLSATESTSSALPQDDGERDPDGYLEVAPDEDSEGTSAGGESSNSAEIERLENELAVAAELNEQFERENEELESRLTQLEEQIAIMQRLLNVQGGDAAALQQQLAEQQAAEEPSAPGDEAGETDSQVAGEQDGASAPGEAAGAPAAEGDQDASKPSRSSSNGSAAEGTASQPSEPQAQPEPQPAPEPVQPQPTTEPGILGFIQEFTAPVTNWITASIRNMVIAGAGALVLLLLPSFIRGRLRKNDDDEVDTLAAAEPDLNEPAFDTDFDDDLLGDFDDEDVLPEGGQEEETSDAVMEAEMYMAYQKYEQAEEKLKAAFAEEPGRTDVGMKLLEVYAETGNSSAFDDLEQRLSLTSEQKSQVDELRARMPMVSGEEADDFSMDLGDDSDLDFGDLEEDEDEDTSPPSLDELEQDLKTESGRYDLSDFESDTDEKKATASDRGEEDLDFSLDLDDLDIPDTGSESTGDESSLDFDMGDLGLEDEEGPEPKKRSEEDTASLDFTLDEDDTGDLDTDLDFSLDETEKPAEPELPTLETEEDDLDFSSLDDTPTQPATTDELPTDDSRGVDEKPSGREFDIDLDERSEPEAPAETAPEPETEAGDDDLRELADSLPGGSDLDDDEFDFLSGSDEASTKLDLARAYIEMDDKEGARDILEEVASEGSDDQKRQAKELMDQI